MKHKRPGYLRVLAALLCALMLLPGLQSGIHTMAFAATDSLDAVITETMEPDVAESAELEEYEGYLETDESQESPESELLVQMAEDALPASLEEAPNAAENETPVTTEDEESEPMPNEEAGSTSGDESIPEDNPVPDDEQELTPEDLAAMARAGELTVDMLLAFMMQTPAHVPMHAAGMPARAAASESIPVSVADQNGTPLSGGSVPESVTSGWINGGSPACEYPLRITDEAGRTYVFDRAMVGEQNCVFVGRVEDYLFFSTDGVSALLLDQPLTFIYHSIYTVTLRESMAEGCASPLTAGTGIVTANGQNLESGQAIEVLSGERLYLSIQAQDNGAVNAAYRRFCIDAVQVNDPLFSTPLAPSMDGKTYELAYDWVVRQDLVVEVTYSDSGSHWVYFPLQTGSNFEVDDNALDSAGYGTYSPGLTSFNFHVRMRNREYPSTMTLFGQDIEVPDYARNYGNGYKTTTVTAPDGTQVDVRVGATIAGLAPNVRYILDVTITAKNGQILRNDYEFDVGWNSSANAVMKLETYVDGVRSNDGATVYYWNGSSLVLTGDGNFVNGNAGFGARAVTGYFIAANPGYRIESFRARQGGWDIIDGTILHVAGPGVSSSGPGYDNPQHWASLSDMPKTLGIGTAGRNEYNSSKLGYSAGDMSYGATVAESMGLTHAAVRVSQAITSFSTYYTQIRTQKINYTIQFTANIAQDVNGTAPELPASQVIHFGDVLSLEEPTAFGYVFTGYKLLNDLAHPDDRYNDSFSVDISNHKLADGYTGAGNDPVNQSFTLQAQFVPVDATYYVHHIAASPYQEGVLGTTFNKNDDGEIVYTDKRVADKLCTIVDAADSDLTALGLPLMNSLDPSDWNLVEGYEVDWDRTEEAWMKAVSEMSGSSPSNDLYVYYKVATVTVQYESSDENLGTVSLEDESRLYHSEETFEGSTAEPKWNVRFTGWTTKDDPDTILSTSLKYVPDLYTDETYVAHFEEITPVADLTISKRIEGDIANYSEVFRFNITIQVPEDAEASLPEDGFAVEGLDGQTALIFDSSHRATVSLGKDDMVTIHDLPASWNITVEELDRASYVTSYSIDGGAAVEGNIAHVTLGDDGKSIEFLNTRNSVPLTGRLDGQNPMLLLGLALFALLAAAAVVLLKRRFFAPAYRGAHLKK